MSYAEVNRREFLAAAGGVAAASMIPDIAWTAATPRRRRYALVGTGMRGDHHVGPGSGRSLWRRCGVRRPV